MANGQAALFRNTTGYNNTATGYTALYYNITGFNNTAIGYNADVASDNLTNATAVGANASVNASNKIQLGNGAVTAVQLGTGTNVTLETGLVKITGGTPGAGKVLTSDAAGLASWTTPSSSGVDLTTAQTIAGVKTFSNGIVANVTGNLTGNASTATTATTATNVSGTVGTANGGTGSSTKNFVDLTTAQTIAGAKTFSSDINVNGITVGKGAGGQVTNTATGFNALSSNILGKYNTAHGYLALFYTTGNYNTAVGHQALIYNQTGEDNTAIGSDALFSNTTGYDNTATGEGALNLNTTGSGNTADGREALNSNTTGSDNTATGIGALLLNSTGGGNTAIGRGALYSNTIGTFNTAIGYGAEVNANNLTNATAIGNGARVNASNKIRIGNASVTVIEGQVAWSTPSDRRLKENIQVNNYLGLNFINKLQPVTYNYISDKTKVRHDGFIAQDIEQIMKDLNMPFSGLKKSSDGMYSLAYSDFVMPMVNAIKEQQSIISELIKKNDSYESQILKLSSKLEEIEKRYSDRK
jgi:hypothetical protein